MKIVRFDESPTFEPRGHAGVLNHALVSTEWHDTPEVSVWWGRFADGGASDLHRHHGATQVYVVLSGTFTVDDGTDEYRLNPRDTAIIGPDDPHRIRAVGDA
ncbi:cupin domain-containing protein, partial [Mycolicibacterium sp.]